jgi:DNA-binding beta-propeller fold protein YncE
VSNASDGTLSNCAVTGSVFNAPTGIAFNGSYAYVADYGNNTVYVCTVGLDGSLPTCLSTGNGFQSPWQLAINGNSNTLYATNIAGGVTMCAINVSSGTLSGCSTTGPGSATSGIAVGPSYAYIGTGPNTVDVCAITLSGSLSPCTSTGSGFVGVNGITLSGGYAYIANQNNSTVSVCKIDIGGTLSGCAASPVGTQPADVVIKGNQAYVDDWDGNVYLCSVAAGALINCAPSSTSFNLGIQIAIH